MLASRRRTSAGSNAPAEAGALWQGRLGVCGRLRHLALCVTGYFCLLELPS